MAARESHGGEARIRSARFPARKALEEFDFDHQRSLKRDTIAHHAGRLQDEITKLGRIPLLIIDEVQRANGPASLQIVDQYLPDIGCYRQAITVVARAAVLNPDHSISVAVPQPSSQSPLIALGT